MRISRLTLDEIKELHPDCYIGVFDAGMVDDEQTDEYVDCADVIVWENEEDSENDDGANAIARYLIPSA